MSQEKVAGIIGVAQGAVAKWWGASNIPENVTCTPPDLKIKVTKCYR